MSYLKPSALAQCAIFAAALALHGPAMAASSAAPASTPQSTAASAGQGAAMWVPGFGPVDQKTVDSLNLNDSQKKLVGEARTAQDSFEKSLDDLKATSRQAQKTQLDTGKIDPHAAQSAADASWKKGMGANRDQLTQKWLAVWDALDSTQQQKVTASLKQSADAPVKPKSH